MADLDTKNSSQMISITGSDSSGSETNVVNANANGNLLTADISNAGGTQGTLNVGTSAVELKVGASPLSNRKNASLFNNSSNTIYWGYTSGVTTSTGTPIFKNQTVVWGIGPSTSVFLIATSVTNDTRITENA
jgi:hypothetical protein